MAYDKLINLKVMSFNMHGFHRGCPVIDDMIQQVDPDVFFITGALANASKLA